MRSLSVTGAMAGAGLLLALLLTLIHAPHLAAAGGTIPPVAPVLLNPEFECIDGYSEAVNGIGETIRTPVAWTYLSLDGSPKANSARIQYTGSCAGSGHVERIGREDSFSLRAQDMETPPAPGKPFDSVLYQQLAVVPDGDYSVSGWFLTLCGGSAAPSDCPDGVYMAKMLGVDPTGGQDPAASSVVWMENRDNFISPGGARIGWQNLRTSAVAQAMTMTVFARIRSPFRWHGNHGFIDSLSLVRAPLAGLDGLPVATGTAQLDLSWRAEQSPDIAQIPGGNYQLLVDVEVRPENGVWRTVVPGHPGTGQQPFIAPCTNDQRYEFRTRARSEQPEGEDGAWPNQRYPGTWSTPISVLFRASDRASEVTATATNLNQRVYLPLIQRDVRC